MSDPQRPRREYLAIAARLPDGTLGRVQISYQRMQTIGKRGLGQASECAYIVPYILENPTAIFEGLRRDEDEPKQGLGWRCYCGVPKCSYRADGSEGPPYQNQFYLVFVNDEGVAYNWRWEQADPHHPDLPQDCETRFRKRLL